VCGDELEVSAAPMRGSELINGKLLPPLRFRA
jgi:hypothetical protein